MTLHGVEDAPRGGDVELARNADAEPTRKNDFDRLGRRWPLGACGVTVEERGNDLDERPAARRRRLARDMPVGLGFGSHTL